MNVGQVTNIIMHVDYDLSDFEVSEGEFANESRFAAKWFRWWWGSGQPATKLGTSWKTSSGEPISRQAGLSLHLLSVRRGKSVGIFSTYILRWCFGQDITKDQPLCCSKPSS